MDHAHKHRGLVYALETQDSGSRLKDSEFWASDFKDQTRGSAAAPAAEAAAKSASNFDCAAVTSMVLADPAAIAAPPTPHCICDTHACVHTYLSVN